MAKKLSDLTKALLETAEDMHQAGAMSDDTYQKIIIRHLGPDAPPAATPISAEKPRGVRKQAQLSQTAPRQVKN